MGISIKDYFTLLFWYLVDIVRWNQYQHYIDMGVLPKYAIEKVKSFDKNEQ